MQSSIVLQDFFCQFQTDKIASSLIYRRWRMIGTKVAKNRMRSFTSRVIAFSDRGGVAELLTADQATKTGEVSKIIGGVK